MTDGQPSGTTERYVRLAETQTRLARRPRWRFMRQNQYRISCSRRRQFGSPARYRRPTTGSRWTTLCCRLGRLCAPRATPCRVVRSHVGVPSCLFAFCRVLARPPGSAAPCSAISLAGSWAVAFGGITSGRRCRLPSHAGACLPSFTGYCCHGASPLATSSRPQLARMGSHGPRGGPSDHHSSLVGGGRHCCPCHRCCHVDCCSYLSSFLPPRG